MEHILKFQRCWRKTFKDAKNKKDTFKRSTWVVQKTHLMKVLLQKLPTIYKSINSFHEESPELVTRIQDLYIKR